MPSVGIKGEFIPMPKSKNFSLYLPEAQKEKVQKAVKSGKYSSQAEYVRELIRKD